ncbi:conserved hypothetical protein [Luteimonas sp. 9C]|uniref:HvfC/BufC N-terminal domain-containing protein n=1 Tax=Luteimonas sp. 9C TaxID=2653148 RepID=UPI0012F1E84A|nr:DNA-binding domain-containing protein [Luteimonas sp. 9C]VXC21145.1 conserved hypothetical protein [Luteimonas sp. 9C]
MNLAGLQSTFMASLHDEAAALPPDWGPQMARGLAVYRNNTRSAQLEAMRSTFERTRRCVGDGPFTAAATHYLIHHPPGSWTLDAVGDGFAELLATLFVHEPDVADIAALDWAMHGVFSAADAHPLDVAAFQQAAIGFDGDDWAGLQLQLVPALAVIDVRTDCLDAWTALTGDQPPPEAPRLAQPAQVVVWRKDGQPVCRLATPGEGDALRQVAAGASYGALCAGLVATHGEDDAVRLAGGLLSGWLHAGLLAALQPPARDGRDAG